MRKILNYCIFLVVMLIFGISNVCAKEVSTINELKSCINDSSICTLKNNIDLSEGDGEIEINKDITIDINGYTITSNASFEEEQALFAITNGTTTIKDSKTTGKISFYEGIIFAVEGGNLKIESGTYISKKSICVYVEDGNLIVNGGKFEGAVGIASDGGTITINYAEVNCEIDDYKVADSDYFAALLFFDSIVKINNGVFGGTLCGIYADSAILNINNGVFVGTVYGIVTQDANLNINNGTFKGEYSGAILYGNDNISLSGGTFAATNSKNAIGAIMVLTDKNHSTKVSDILSSGYAFYDDNTIDFGYINIKNDDFGFDDSDYYSYTKAYTVNIKNPEIEKTSSVNSSNLEKQVENPKTGDINVYFILFIIMIIISIQIFAYKRVKSKKKYF